MSNRLPAENRNQVLFISISNSFTHKFGNTDTVFIIQGALVKNSCYFSFSAVGATVEDRAEVASSSFPDTFFDGAGYFAFLQLEVLGVRQRNQEAVGFVVDIMNGDEG